MNAEQFFNIIFNPAVVWLVNYILILFIIVISIGIFKARKVFFPYISALLSKSRILRGVISGAGRLDFETLNLKKGILWDKNLNPLQTFKEKVTYTLKKGSSEITETDLKKIKDLSATGYKIIKAEVTKKDLGYFLGGMPIKLYLTDAEGMLALDENLKSAPLSVTMFKQMLAQKEEMDKDRLAIFKHGINLDKAKTIAILMTLIILGVIVYAIVSLFV